MPHVHHDVSSFPLAPALVILCVGVAYALGYISELGHANVTPAWRTSSFFIGLFSMWIAIGSPLAALDHEWLTAHMIQHLLLMTIGPPLVWLGAPAAALRMRALVRPTVCWAFAVVVLIGWHVPAIFTLGMQSPGWHSIERASFLLSGLLFWLPVVEATSTSTEPRWSVILYLFLATLPCDLLAGFLVFSERVAYPIYFGTSHHISVSVLDDQECAGAVMWTCVTIVYLTAGTLLTARWLNLPVGRTSTSRREPRIAKA